MRLTLMLLAVTGLLFAQTPPTYVGPGGCASSNCHGGTTPVPESQNRILGNEYATWSVSDRHSRAYKVLLDPRAKRMAEILKISDASRDRRCTVCHVVGTDAKSPSDGVACEACHGSANGWLGTHKQANSHADSVAKGMIDTKNLDVRAKTCLGCHLGAGEQSVDHDLIAAGHPDLAFELDTFTAAQPMHHRDPKPAAGNSLPRVRAWAVGQASALAQGMRLLADHTAKSWPEFSDLECYQCHHDLRAESWRIQRGYGARRPGTLQVNLARFEVLRVLVAQAAPDQRAPLDGAMTRLDNLTEEKLSDRAAIAAAARDVERIATGLTAQFLTRDFTAAVANASLRALTADIQRIADAGVNAAEQATMSLDALTAALAKKPEAVTALYNYLEHPSTYKPSEFVALYRRAAAE